MNIFAHSLLTREQAVILSLIRLAVGAGQVKANSIPEPGTGLYYRLGRHLKVISGCHSAFGHQALGFALLLEI